MKKYAVLWTALLTLLAAGHSQAQLGGPELESPMLKAGEWKKLFGDVNAFTATCDMRILAKGEKTPTTMVMKMSYLEGKMRTDMDMAQMQSPDLPPQAVQQMKQMGMDKMTGIMLPETKKMLLIYPGLQGYVEMPLPKDEVAALEKEPKIEKTALGKETINGQACVKNKVVITDAAGKQQELTVWNATSLKEFPVKVETAFEDRAVTIHYKDVNLGKPDSKQFEPPSGFAKHNDLQQLIMKKMLGQ